MTTYSIQFVVIANKVWHTEMKCWACQTNGLQNHVKGYDHDGGWDVFGQRRWLYIDCPKCGYQTSFEKLGVDKNF